MSVLISNLNMIESIKLDIASAIEAKGVSMSGVSFPDYPSAIASISGGGGGYTEKDITEKAFNIVNLNNSASYVGYYAFMSMSLQTVNLSMCEHMDECAFQFCYSLTQVSLPVCNYISSFVFNDCSSLSYVSLPMCEHIGNGAFRHCISLTEVSLPMCNSLGNEAFRSCTNLSVIMIGKDISTVATLGNNAFRDTPITSGTGIIYVPASLVSDYQAANYWSIFASQIVSIPE